MASVHLLTTAANSPWSPYLRSDYERLLRAARSSQRERHRLTEIPEEADFVLFVNSRDRFHSDILRSAIYKTYSSKCFVFDLQDETIPLLSGFYMTVPPHLLSVPIYRYGFYPRVFDNSMLEVEPFSAAEYLFSFIGTVENRRRLRQQIVNLEHPRAFLRDSSSGQSDSDSQYVSVLQKSKFVLCPRGKGASTWRCFEAMKAGRVPVIISDPWSEPPGMDWSKFSVRARESEVHNLPQRLEILEPKAEVMGLAARAAWEKHFALDTCFDWIVEQCLGIQENSLEYSHFTIRNRWKESLRGKYFSSYWKEILRRILPSTWSDFWYQRKARGRWR